MRSVDPATLSPARRQSWAIIAALTPVLALVLGGLAPAQASPATESLASYRPGAGGWSTSGAQPAYDTPETFAAENVMNVNIPGSTARLSLAGVDAADGVSTLTFTLPQAPVGGSGLRVATELRRVNNSLYRAIARWSPAGTIGLSIDRIDGGPANVTSLAGETNVLSGVSAGEAITVELAVSGSTTVALEARAWRTDGQRPSAAQRVASDSSAQRLGEGGAAYWAYSSSSQSAGGYVDVLSYQLTSSGTTLASGASTAAKGWSDPVTGGSFSYTNSGALATDGTIELARAGTSAAATFSSLSAKDVSVSGEFAIPALPTKGSGVRIALVARSSSTHHYRAVLLVQPSGSSTLSIDRIDGSAAAVTSIAKSVPGPRVSVGATIALAFDAVNSGSAVGLNAEATSSGVTSATSATDESTEALGAGSAGVWTYLSGNSDAARIAVASLDVDPGLASAVPSPSASATASPAPTASPSPTATPSPSASPTVAPTVAPTAAPPVTVPETGGTIGSAVVGTTRYAVPANAVFVSPSGSDTNAGTQAAPLRTIARAQQVAPVGGTVVLRGGSYHENLKLNQSKKLTIQSYPGEAVWMDGSSVVTGWVKSGAVWVKSGWTAEFDASPTYARGAPDGEEEGWVSVNKEHPMASHPDQVWINGTALAQVGSLAQVATGTFYVDYATDKLYIGSDPSGKEVRASDLSMAFAIQTSDQTIRGIGVRRYATPTPDMGTVRVDNPAVRTVIENVVFEQNATIALSVSSLDSKITNVTARDNGRQGLHANNADRLQIKNVSVVRNNAERFNPTPFGGGIKITKSRGVSVTSSVVSNNYANGLWCDQSCYNLQVVNSDLSNNLGAGLFYEISAKATFANNVILGNLTGLMVQNSSGVEIWNNAISGVSRTLTFDQDPRTYAGTSYGQDPRYPNDPAQTWLVGNATVSNNVFIGSADPTRWCGVICAFDQTSSRTGNQMGISSNGNVFYRASASEPKELVRWGVTSRGAGAWTFPNLGTYQAASGQDLASLELTGSSAYPLNAGGTVTAAIAAKAASVAQPVPAAISAVAPALVSGSRVLGPQR